MQSVSPTDPQQGASGTRSADAWRRGSLQQVVLAVGTGMALLMLGLCSSCGWSPWTVAPVIVATAAMAWRAGRQSMASMHQQVDVLEAARRSAIADATMKAQFWPT